MYRSNRFILLGLLGVLVSETRASEINYDDQGKAKVNAISQEDEPDCYVDDEGVVWRVIPNPVVNGEIADSFNEQPVGRVGRKPAGNAPNKSKPKQKRERDRGPLKRDKDGRHHYGIAMDDLPEPRMENPPLIDNEHMVVYSLKTSKKSKKKEKK